MKPLFKLAFALLICVMFGIYANAEEVVKKKVAVYVTGEDVESSVLKVLGARLVTAITSSGDFAAVERTSEFLEALTKENDYQASGEVRDSQIAKLGQKFGVKYVAVADVSSAFDEIFVAARLINVETGLVERAYDAYGPAENMQQLISLSQDVAAGLLKGLSRNMGSSGKSTGSGGTLNGHEYVDLGLPSGLKWATCNVGASSPSDYGSYFAWGETFTKGEYTDSNCRTFDRTFGDISGNVEYDAARANWGGSWRLPTKAEFEELLNNCQWTFITMGNHNGYKVIGPNGNYIFLPAAGYRGGTILFSSGSSGLYWSSSPYDTKNSYVLYFSSSSREVDWNYRRNGRSVRAVTE